MVIPGFYIINNCVKACWFPMVYVELRVLRFIRESREGSSV